MADRALDNNHSFRKFLNDPKTSVMGYIAENIPADRMGNTAQGQSGRPFASPHPQYAEMQHQQASSQQGPNQPGNNLGYQNQQGYGSESGNGGPSYGAQGHINGPQRFSPPPLNSQPPSSQPHVASNLSQHQLVDPRYEIPQSEATSQVPTHQHSGLLHSISHLGQSLSSRGDQTYNPQLGYLNSSGQASGPSLTVLGHGPPLPGQRRKSSPQSASRMYHRMILDFEVVRNSYFDVKKQNKSQEMSTAAYELESLSQKIWTLRRDHAGDFEEFSELGHASVIASWQAQYELWADTVLDLQDAQTLNIGSAPGNRENAVQVGSQSAWGTHQELPRQNMAGGPSIQPQSPPYMQNGQIQPEAPNVFSDQQRPPMDMQSSQPLQPEPSIQPSPPGAFPQNNSPGAHKPQIGSSPPPQQQLQNSQPQQMPPTQSPLPIPGPNMNPNQKTAPKPNMPAPYTQNTQSYQNMQQRLNMPPNQSTPRRNGPNRPPGQNMPLRQDLSPGNGQNGPMQDRPPRPGSTQVGQVGR